MPLLLKSRSRRISACRPGRIFFPVLRRAHSRQRQRSVRKSRCLTHMAAVCSTPASFSLIFLTFAPAHLLQPPSLTLSPPPSGFVPSLPFCFSAFLLCCMPTSPYLPPYIATSLPASVFFFHLYFSAHQVPFALYLLLHLPPPIYLHVHQFYSTLPLVFFLPACLSASRMSFNWQALFPFSLSSLPELI